MPLKPAGRPGTKRKYARYPRRKKKRPENVLATKGDVKRAILHNQKTNHFLKQDYIGINVDLTPQIIDMSQIVQGDRRIDRTGATVQNMTLDFTYDILVGDATNLLRVTLFQWYENDATSPPNLNTLYENGGIAPNVSMWNTRYRNKEFAILYDRKHVLTQTSNDQVHVDRMGLKPKRNKITFNPGSVLGNNKIYLIVSSDSGVVPHPDFFYQLRINFKNA